MSYRRLLRTRSSLFSLRCHGWSRFLARLRCSVVPQRCFSRDESNESPLLTCLAVVSSLLHYRQAEADVTAEPTAFVTFRSRVAQTIASTALQDHDTGAWTVAPAPGPDEIIWTNLGMRAWLRGIRSLIVNAAYICIILFYGLPVTALQVLLGFTGTLTCPVVLKLPLSNLRPSTRAFSDIIFSLLMLPCFLPEK